MNRVLWGVVLLAAVLAGCSAPSQPVASASATTVPLTSRIVAELVQDELGGEATSAWDAKLARSVSASVHYRATSKVPAWTVTTAFGPSSGWLAATGCKPTTGTTGALGCYEDLGVRVAWLGRDGLLVVSPRGQKFVTIRVTGLDWVGDPRKGHAPVALSKLLALARDARLDAATDSMLPLQAANLPNWRDDLECALASRAGTIALPSNVASGGLASATPQAFAAVLASEVNAKCLGEWSGTVDEVGAVAFFGTASEWLAAYVTTNPAAGQCPAGWTPCQVTAGVTVAYRFNRPAKYPAKVWLSRPVDGGYLVVQQASQKADPVTRVFPVPMMTMQGLVRDDHLGFLVPAGFTAAGDALPVCWRIAPRLDPPPATGLPGAPTTKG